MIADEDRREVEAQRQASSARCTPFALGVERPDVGLLQVLRDAQPPDPGGVGVAAPAAEADAQGVGGLLVDRVAGGLDEALDSLRVAGAGEVDAVDALGEGLLDHPAAGCDGRFVEAEQGQGGDNGRRAVAARGGAGVDQAAYDGPPIVPFGLRSFCSLTN